MMTARVMRRSLYLVTIMMLFTAGSILAADDEALGRAAEQSGKLREALPHYVAALQSASEGSATEQRLREAIIKLVQKLDPPPAVPEEAERRMARGRAAVKTATDTQGYERAVKEFYAATKVAPWLAEAYYNLGVVNEKAGRYSEVVQSLKWYLLAAPHASDAKAVRDLIYEIEYRQEEEKRAQADTETRAARQEQARAAMLQGLPGRWREKDQFPCFEVTVTGNEIKIIHFEWQRRGDPSQCYQTDGSPVWRGTIEGLTFRGVWSQDLSKDWTNGSYVSRPMEGTISEDGRKIHLKYTGVYAAGAKGNTANGWREHESEKDLYH